MSFQIRQGDVLLVQVSFIPKKRRRVELENGRIVLAHGEVTGHAHAIADVDHVSMFEVDNGIRYLEVQMDAHLRHEEHGMLTVPAGNYRVVRQREYSPEAIRNVAD